MILSAHSSGEKTLWMNTLKEAANVFKKKKLSTVEKQDALVEQAIWMALKSKRVDGAIKGPKF